MQTTSFPSLNPTPQIQLRVRPSIAALQEQLVRWRRQFHQYPELGFQEHQTAAFIHDRLQEWGIDHEVGVAETGVVATIPGQHPGKVLAIRADMDGLPVQELNEAPYRSQIPGQMHACGHDGHVAIALGTAYYLSQNPDFRGTVKLIFQPAEEGPGGAKPMIEAGVLQNPTVDAIVGLHLWNNLPLGTVGVRSGPLMAAVESFEVTLQGRGGHGAMPHQTVDAIVVGAQVVNALQAIVSRNVDPVQSAVVTVGAFNAGQKTNIIADQAHLKGTVRYFNPQYEGFFAKRIEGTIAGICQAHGASYQLNYQPLYPPLINDDRMTHFIRSVAESVLETPAGIVPDCQTMGGEDMSFFLQAVPGCYFFLGTANLSLGLSHPHHHPRFDFDETALAWGVELFVRCVEQFESGSEVGKTSTGQLIS
ncbi:MAG: M20 metallopeptidase family protein [Prochlorotrichaceae cyanobacterium]|jgi:amidohydrolase